MEFLIEYWFDFAIITAGAVALFFEDKKFWLISFSLMTGLMLGLLIIKYFIWEKTGTLL